MANPLASTTFGAGPKDSLATLDVYASNGQKVVNSIQALSAKAGIDFAGLFGTKLPTNLSGVLNATAGAVGINKQALITRLAGVSGSLKNAFGNLSENIQGEITGGYVDSGVVMTKVNGITSTVSSANFSDVSSLSSFLNTYTTSLTTTSGNNPLYSVQDEDGMACMISGVVNEGSGLGVSGIYGQLTGNLTSTTLISKVVDQSVPSLIANSDLDTLNDMSSSAGSVMGALFPNFSTNLVQNFQSTLNGFERNPAQAFNKLVGTLDNVKANWYAFVRNPSSTALSLLGMAGASQDLLNIVTIGTALLDNGDSKKYMALGARYPTTTLQQSIRKFFPNTVLTTGLKKDPKAVTVSPAVNNLLGVVIQGLAAGL